MVSYILRFRCNGCNGCIMDFYNLMSTREFLGIIKNRKINITPVTGVTGWRVFYGN